MWSVYRWGQNGGRHASAASEAVGSVRRLEAVQAWQSIPDKIPTVAAAHWSTSPRETLLQLAFVSFFSHIVKFSSVILCFVSLVS